MSQEKSLEIVRSLAPAEPDDIPESATLKKAKLGLDPEQYLAREQVGRALLAHSLGSAVAANLKMRQGLETASDILLEEVLSQPLPADSEAANAVMGLKIKATSALGMISDRHLKLTKELVGLAELNGKVLQRKTSRSVAPQTFNGVNYIQNNHGTSKIATEPGSTETDS